MEPIKTYHIPYRWKFYEDFAELYKFYVAFFTHHFQNLDDSKPMFACERERSRKSRSSDHTCQTIRRHPRETLPAPPNAIHPTEEECAPTDSAFSFIHCQTNPPPPLARCRGRRPQGAQLKAQRLLRRRPLQQRGLASRGEEKN